MNRKINTICFIFLLLFLITAVSAANNENETTINIPQPDPNQDLCKLSVENDVEKLGVSLKAVTKKEKVLLDAPDLKMHYKDGSKFKVTLKDKNKKPITKAKINFTVHGKSYIKKTDNKGVAFLDINLKSGNYIILTKFQATSKYDAISKKSNITVKSTIKCSDFTKFYTNKASYYSTFYNQKGRLLKNTTTKFKINNKEYSIKTNAKGVGKLAINLKPGKYSILLTNPKTSETVSKTVTVKSLIETKDLTINGSNTGKFSVKILNSNGKASPNKKVTFTIEGKTYSKKTDKSGIAALDINLDAGTHKITTEYNGLKNTNNIRIIKSVESSSFMHSTLIPNYVNVTTDYVYYNSVYSLKTGDKGIIKMPKNEVFRIQIGSKRYTFSTVRISGINSTLLGYKSYLIPFDGSGIKSDAKKANLKKDGIIITRIANYTQIDYQSKTKDNVALFGFYASKGLDNSETLTYMEGDEITAKVSFQTQGYDELGLKYSLSKFYGKSIYDFNYKSYDEITKHNAKSIKFTNTDTPVTFSYFGNYIVGYPSKEDIITKFKINGKDELEKSETISYGLSENYRNAMGFEVLQSFSIINEKVTREVLERCVSKSSDYLNRFGVMNVYGMHLACLETAWLADELADKHAKDFNVKWKRNNTSTILGGINLKDTYLDILNADMGMSVTGNDVKNIILFRMLNSIYLPYLEDYSLDKVSKRFGETKINSLDCIYSAIKKNNFSLVQLGDLLYLIAEDGSESAMVMNIKTGIASVIVKNGNDTYKGSAISTTKDCCSVGIIPNDIIKGIKETLKSSSPTTYLLSDEFSKIHPLSLIAYSVITAIFKKASSGVTSLGLGLFATMALAQTVGVKYRDMNDKNDWHELMDKVTFTRPGYLQGKKIYNIPNKKGGTDYIEVKINNDLTLDRNNAIYISNGKTKQLTKQETYKYFCEDIWTPFSMPTKYWDKSWKG
ncbi:Ig-like domain-containing protein [Methanobrevibacter sp.]|uniref:Ig-like domain-containing protein n=1 Tax=Methanobrevibacter sp. TaxID=66852 RepID=UPI00386CDB40